MSGDLRVILYSHDSVGLGHLRRSLSVAAALTRKEPGAACLCITGSPAPTVFELPPGCETLKLPCLGKNDAGDYVSLRLDVPAPELAHLRAELIVSAARAFRPHLVVVDHTATGPLGELLPLLTWARAQVPRPRVVLGMRDILDAPERTRQAMQADGIYDVLARFYDEVLVYGERELFDVCQAYALPAEVCAKTSYVGFVCPPAAPTAPPGNGHHRHIVASAGGGHDGYQLLHAVTMAMRQHLHGADLDLTVVTGPLMPAAQAAALRRQAEADPRVRVLGSTKEMSHLMATADLVIGMAGYNSVYEALQRGRRLLVCPRMWPRLEQLERARRLSERGYLTLLPAAATQDPALVANFVHHALAEPSRPATFDFAGAERAAARLLAGLHQGCHALPA